MDKAPTPNEFTLSWVLDFTLVDRAFYTPEPFYCMDTVAEAPWMGLPCSFYFTDKQTGLLKEAAVEAHVKPSAAWVLLHRPHGWVYAAFLMGLLPLSLVASYDGALWK